MLLSELAEIIMIESGEFLLDDMDMTDILVPRFWRIVKKELESYQKHKPLTKKFNIECSRVHTFREEEGRIPYWISYVVPSSHYKNLALAEWNHPLASNSDNNPYLEISRNFIWKYEEPKLYASEVGLFDITAHYKYEQVITKDDKGKIIEVEIPELDEDRVLVDMILAKFMIALGRSRRAFTLNELPVSMDGSELVSEGQELYRDSKESLYDNNKWRYALGES